VKLVDGSTERSYRGCGEQRDSHPDRFRKAQTRVAHITTTQEDEFSDIQSPRG
jgi:hypothetical protein